MSAPPVVSTAASGTYQRLFDARGELVALRTELRNGDRVEIITAPQAAPNPAWLGFVKTGKARAIRFSTARLL